MLGLAFNKAIKAHLFAPVPVACAFVAGAFVILWAERRQRLQPSTIRIATIDDMRWTDALKVGLRAGVRAHSRHVALRRDDHRRHAVRPVARRGHRVFVLPRDSDAVRRHRLFAVEGFDAACPMQSLPAFGVGFAAAFVSAFACVRWLIRYVAHHDFVPFAWYRIAFGAVILVTAYAGLVRWD